MSDISKDGVSPASAPVNAADGAQVPKSPGQRVMLGVVIILGLLIMLALGAVVVGLTMKVRGTSPRSAGSASATALTLPAGARIEAMEVSGNRLILRLKTDTGEEIDIVDTADGHLVSRLRAAPPAVPQ